MKHPLLLATLLLASCATVPSEPQSFESLERNPLMAEVMADQMLDAVAAMQIRANENGEPITDPVTLRAIDETFIVAKGMRDRAHERQDAGKLGHFFGVNDGYAEGRALLLGESLYFGYTFLTEPLPGMRVLLAAHVSPHTEDELFSDTTQDLGPLQNLLGPQEYRIGKLSQNDRDRFRTVVIYSDLFKRVLGLAQIRKGVGE